MTMLKSATALISAVALFATPVAASAASYTNANVSVAAGTLGKRIGNGANADIKNQPVKGTGGFGGGRFNGGPVAGGIAAALAVFLLLDKKRKRVSG